MTIAQKIPAAVRELCARLQERAFEAVAVGGAVRDALLGRSIGDWDVATRASPAEVMGLFPKTIATGLQHGTVTVLHGDMAIEVTTFRSDGTYGDGRHPDAVRFGVSLEEDLSRRDFLINAIAYDPVADRLLDPLHGQIDLEKRVVRAVGDPALRFREDSLRMLRAIRFTAALQFDLEPQTEAAIPPLADLLRRVSRERVRDELLKMLSAADPGRAMTLIERNGLADIVFPGCVKEKIGMDERLNIRLERASDVWVRLALTLRARSASSETLESLKLSRSLSRHVDALLHLPAGVTAPRDVRGALSAVGRAAAQEAVAVWSAEGNADAASIGAASIARGDALEVAELALTGADLMRLSGRTAGPWVGECQRRLLDYVLWEPERNDRDHLEAVVRAWFESGS